VIPEYSVILGQRVDADGPVLDTAAHAL